MASYVNQKVKCGCCGATFQTNILKGLYVGRHRSLDGNPNHPAIYGRVVQCPNCGYSSDCISNTITEAEKQYVASKEYRNAKMSNESDATATKLMCAALFAASCGDDRKAGRFYRMLSWYYSDDIELARAARANAIDHDCRWLQNTQNVEMALVLIDCMRRNDLFDDARETAESLRPYLTEEEKRILEFEERRILAEDDSDHLLSEVAL